jgi:hypothetical protein
MLRRSMRLRWRDCAGFGGMHSRLSGGLCRVGDGLLMGRLDAFFMGRLDARRFGFAAGFFASGLLGLSGGRALDS